MSNKRVGIVTIISENFGNRLQNYALQETLKDFGYDVKTIPFMQLNFKKRIKMIILNVLSLFPSQRIMNTRWNTFNKKINWYSHLCDYENINNDFEFFIAGSDQIWNPYFGFNSEREFLTFAESDKRITYAASIGVNSLPEEIVNKYKEMIESIPYVSMRENEGAKIVKDLIGKEVPVVLDPTMLLSANAWKSLLNESSISIGQKYIFKYFLGSENDVFSKKISSYAEEKDLLVIDVMQDSNFFDSCGPIEFLYLINNAEYVFVDSFHAAVFSLLFNKHFIVLERPFEEKAGYMGSRIKTLLSTFNMSDRLIHNVEDFYVIEKTYDYDIFTKTLNEKKELSKEFLKKALNNY